MKTAPAYQTVKLALIELIRQREWKYGQAIPSEPLLARRFGVSIGTIRRAVSELVADNLVAREQGRGTFVASHTRDYMLDVFFRIVDEQGRKELPTAQLLDFRRTRIEAAAAEQLRVPVGSPAFRIQNLQSIAGKPVILETIWLPADKFPGLTEYMFTHRDGTIFGLYQQSFGHMVVHCVESLQAVVADARTRTHLKLQAPAAALRVVRTAITDKDVAVETRVRFIDTRELRYLSLLGRRS